MKILMTIPVEKNDDNAVVTFNIEAESLKDPVLKKVCESFFKMNTEYKPAKKDYISMFIFVYSDFHVTDLIDEKTPTIIYSEETGLRPISEFASLYSIEWYSPSWHNRDGIRFKVKPTKERLLWKID